MRQPTKLASSVESGTRITLFEDSRMLDLIPNVAILAIMVVILPLVMDGRPSLSRTPFGLDCRSIREGQGQVPPLEHYLAIFTVKQSLSTFSQSDGFLDHATVLIRTRFNTGLILCAATSVLNGPEIFFTHHSKTLLR